MHQFGTGYREGDGTWSIDQLSGRSRASFRGRLRDSAVGRAVDDVREAWDSDREGLVVARGLVGTPIPIPVFPKGHRGVTTAAQPVEDKAFVLPDRKASNSSLLESLPFRSPRVPSSKLNVYGDAALRRFKLEKKKGGYERVSRIFDEEKKAGTVDSTNVVTGSSLKLAGRARAISEEPVTTFVKATQTGSPLSETGLPERSETSGKKDVPRNSSTTEGGSLCRKFYGIEPPSKVARLVLRLNGAPKNQIW
ncbi:hypothetical protein CROQUDRAFT_88515 [Cronartium quercuum f. sp. fusiforme G11]|uniref:Uncharacterized protein n=1 Tax=Cronartium quercuum f. sp. fusiforme G11 TaxID=708437 RepID=A0A9P6NQ35_9BASI|nr:hypothetical protein CROQUDRAFT_88515 [Cronartium quercuum f. sp. fusiforme G11]